MKGNKTMKKMMSVLLVLALTLCMGMTVFAAPAGGITQSGGSAAHDVNATYQAGGSAATIYSVDVTWGSMGFTYTDAGAGTWNPNTHEYDGATAAAWSCPADDNKITLTNHSNTNVAATLSYAPGTSYNTINGIFSKGTISLATAVGTPSADAPTDDAMLTLTGILSSSITTSTKIGSVTVTLS